VLPRSWACTNKPRKPTLFNKVFFSFCGVLIVIIIFLGKSTESCLWDLIFNVRNNALLFLFQFALSFLHQSLSVLVALQRPLGLLNVIALLLLFAHLALLLSLVLAVRLVGVVIGLELCFQLLLVEL
jgi:hypothetical protein